MVALLQLNDFVAIDPDQVEALLWDFDGEGNATLNIGMKSGKVIFIKHNPCAENGTDARAAEKKIMVARRGY